MKKKRKKERKKERLRIDINYHEPCDSMILLSFYYEEIKGSSPLFVVTQWYCLVSITRRSRDPVPLLVVTIDMYIYGIVKGRVGANLKFRKPHQAE